MIAMGKRHLAVCVLLLFAASARAADAPFVVTLPTVVDTMLKMGGVTAGDYVIDLGSGDGRIVIAAARQHGARGYGVELDPNLVNTARREAQRQGVADRVTFEAENLFNIDISKASVITMYIGESVNLRLRPALLKLKPGTRIVSHDFDLGNWPPDEKVTIPVPGKPYGPPRSDIMLWVVPADASGRWRWSMGEGTAPLEAQLEQTFQMLAGAVHAAGRGVPVQDARVRGEQVSFSVMLERGGRALRHEFKGRLSGDTIEGEVRAEGLQAPWRARRSARGKWHTDLAPAKFETPR
ncbi:MAG: methyltransferase domain-containing protein [Betaproteobacteria bacterium]|nr:methyltransferase domain-containing protein [Betaproteobacteria bacterium]